MAESTSRVCGMSWISHIPAMPTPQVGPQKESKSFIGTFIIRIGFAVSNTN